MEVIAEYRPIIATIAGIVALLVLILRVKMNAFAALMLLAISVAVAAGMAPEAAFDTVKKGMGGTLGFIAPIIGLGALFGAILESSGGVQALAQKISRSGSIGSQRWSMGGLGIVAATPVFFDVALIILLPFIAALSTRTGKAAMNFGLPLCAGLAVGHAFIPPTPGPIAIAELIGAEIGTVILFGAITGLFTVAVAGPIWSSLLDKIGQMPVGNLHHTSSPEEGAVGTVSSNAALMLILLPLILILVSTMAGFFLEDGGVRSFITLVGHPFSALLIASGAAFLAMGARTEPQKKFMNDTLSRAFEPTGIVILVTGAGGAFKQVLVDTGAGAQLAEATLSFGLTPLFAGFFLALLVRLAQGSATVAMITGAGLAAPIVAAAELSAPQLSIVAIAIAAGASGFSHVNDSGFWLVSRLFGISETETLKTWTMATGLISIVGLIVCAILYSFV